MSTQPPHSFSKCFDLLFSACSRLYPVILFRAFEKVYVETLFPTAGFFLLFSVLLCAKSRATFCCRVSPSSILSFSYNQTTNQPNCTFSPSVQRESSKATSAEEEEEEEKWNKLSSFSLPPPLGSPFFCPGDKEERGREREKKERKRHPFHSMHTHTKREKK